MRAIRDHALTLAVFLTPCVGVGVVTLLTGSGWGTGIQPAFLPILLAFVLTVPAVRELFGDAHTQWWWAALLWTVASTASLWTLPRMEMLGEVPWSKGAKQLVMLLFFAGIAVVTEHALHDDREGKLWSRLERAASASLLFACVIAFAQAVAFQFPSAWFDDLDRFFASNPSIAAGSGELYLGHSFVGIPRLRGPLPEPLLFGSYLLAAIPVTFAAAWSRRGRARLWRGLSALAGTACLVGTFSRGAWLGFVALFVMLVLGWRLGRVPGPRGRRGVVTVLGVVVVGSLGFWQLSGVAPWDLPGLLLDRLAQTRAGHDMSNQTRWWSWSVARDLFLSHPLQGVGWGGFGFHFFEGAGVGADAAHFGWPVVNSLPLLVLAETGLIGASLWLGALRTAFMALVRPLAGPRSFLLAASCVGLAVHGLTFSQWNLPHLWFLIAASSASFRLDRERVA